jgi:hypothetical protein
MQLIYHHLDFSVRGNDKGSRSYQPTLFMVQKKHESFTIEEVCDIITIREVW